MKNYSIDFTGVANNPNVVASVPLPILREQYLRSFSVSCYVIQGGNFFAIEAVAQLGQQGNQVFAEVSGATPGLGTILLDTGAPWATTKVAWTGDIYMKPFTNYVIQATALFPYGVPIVAGWVPVFDFTWSIDDRTRFAGK